MNKKKNVKITKQ